MIRLNGLSLPETGVCTGPVLVDLGERRQQDPRIALEMGADLVQHLGARMCFAREVAVELGAIDVQGPAHGRDRRLGGHQLPQVAGEDRGYVDPVLFWGHGFTRRFRAALWSQPVIGAGT